MEKKSETEKLAGRVNMVVSLAATIAVFLILTPLLVVFLGPLGLFISGVLAFVYILGKVKEAKK